MQDFDQKLGVQGCYPCTPIVKGGLLPAPFLVAARAFWPLIFSTLSHHPVEAVCSYTLSMHPVAVVFLSDLVLMLLLLFFLNYMKVDPKRKNFEKWIEKLKFSASSQSVKCGTYHSSGKSIVNYCLMFRLHRFLPSASWRCILPSRVFFAVPFLVVLGHLVWRGEQHLACENTCVICS